MAAVREFLDALAAVTRGARVVDVVVEGSKAAVGFDIESAEGVIEGFEGFEISGGQMKRLRPWFDTRPLLNGNI